jgi:polysaccharide export outer membrane protein
MDTAIAPSDATPPVNSGGTAPRTIYPIEVSDTPENTAPEAVLDEAIAAPAEEISDPAGAAVSISTVPDATVNSSYASATPGMPTAPFQIASLSAGIPAAAVDGTYTLGAGDRVRMDVMNVPEYSGERQVLVDGSLSLPLIGNVRVDGMTMEQASSVIAERYRPLVRGPLVSLTLVQPRPLRVSIAGEVVRPGSYNLTLSGDRQFPSVVQAIQAAQGLTQAANLRQVQVQRPRRGAAPQLITVNLWDLLQNGDLRQDLTLRDGDSILIPASRQVNLAEANQLSAANFAATAQTAMNVAIVGEVQRPGTHRLEVKGEAGGQPTLTQAIQTAGGITATADIRQVQVRRPTRSGSPQVININLWQLLQSGDVQQDLALQQGDTIVIPTATAMTPAEATQLASASFSPSQINVSVVGEVNNPGRIAVAPNTPLNQALLTAGGFNRRAGRSVELVRLNPNGTVTRQRIEVDLAQNVSDQRNPLLRNNDVILIGRSGAARFSDGLESVLGPIFRILPLVGLF